MASVTNDIAETVTLYDRDFRGFRRPHTAEVDSRAL
jgi:hypothetical protein